MAVNDNKICWIDVETTGLYESKNGIIQLAAIVEIQGSIKDVLELKMQPHEGAEIDDKALKVNGVTRAELATYQSNSSGFKELLQFLDLHVDKYNRGDKYIFAGHNAQFDMGFVKRFFKVNGSNYFGSYFEYKPLDTYPLAFALDLIMDLRVPNHKLATLAKRFGIEIDAHDALSDIQATRELFWEMAKMIKVKHSNVEEEGDTIEL